MTSGYTAETQKILDEFLETLGKHPKLNAGLLKEMRQMLADSALGSTTRIERAIDTLKDYADGLQDQ